MASWQIARELQKKRIDFFGLGLAAANHPMLGIQPALGRFQSCWPGMPY